MPSKAEAILVQTIRASIFLVLLLPLFVYEKSLFPFVFPRTIAFRVLVEIALASYLVLAILRKEYRVRRATLVWLVFGFVAAMIIASTFGVDRYHSFWSSIERGEGILTWLHLLAFFIILLGTFRTKKAWLQLLNVALLPFWLQAVYSLGQIFDWAFVLKTTGERPSGTLGNPSFFASYLIFLIFLAAYLFSQYRVRLVKGYYLTIIISATVLLWFTQNRGAFLGFLCGWLFFLVIKIFRKEVSLRIKAGFFTILTLIIIFGAFVFANKNEPWIFSSPTLYRLTNLSRQDITVQNRLIVWNSGLKAFRERPFLGWGWENFNAAFNKNFDPAITRDIGSRPWYDRAHNTIVEVAVASGILGLAMYLAIFAWLTKLLWPWTKNGEIITDKLILLSLLFAYFVQNLFVFDTLNTYLMFFLLMALVEFQKRETEANDKEQPAKLPEPLSAKLAVAVIVFSLLPAVYFFNLRPALANIYAVQALIFQQADPVRSKKYFERAFLYTPSNDYELRFVLIQHARDQLNLQGFNEKTLPLIELATAEAEKSIKVAAQFVPNHLLLAELYLAILGPDRNFLDKAEELAFRALAEAPRRYQTYTLLGRIKMSQARFEEGIDYFKQAITLNDKFAEAHWNLAIAYILSGHAPEAQGELDRAYELGFDVYKDNNTEKLLQAYSDSKDLAATVSFLENLTRRFPDNQNYRQELVGLQNLLEQVLEAARR